MRRLARLGGVAATAALLFVTACGTDGQENPPPSPDPTGSPEAAAGEGAGGTGADDITTVTLSDFEIGLSRTEFSPGTYRFKVVREGSHPHSLAISGPGVEVRTTVLGEGRDATELLLTLREGTYRLWCQVDDHQREGMETTIEVA